MLGLLPPLEDLLKNVEHYDWLYNKFADERSRMTFTYIMQFWLVPDLTFIEAACDERNQQFFDKSIVCCDENEVFVNCSGSAESVTKAYTCAYGEYKKIYAYEPCKTISLDADIPEKITFIKIDIEGLETSVLLGGKNHIRNDSPKLAVCGSSTACGMWELLKLIDYMNPNYHFYLRRYMNTLNRGIVLYAIPADHCSRKGKMCCSQKKIVAMAPYERGWSNVELIKDCGLIPYLLHKNYGYDVSMVGADNGPYPYHEKYIKEVTMEFLPNGQITEKLRYLKKHAEKIDGLLLRGCYPNNFPIAEMYKTLNPEGKIYVGLDANSWWMNRILWDEEQFINFMNHCDVIATSCHAMQKHLNEKWPWKIEYIPNGYYNFSECQNVPAFREKKNIILTVGRLGTEQKATEILLEAFAKIAEKIPDWKLHLVGNVEHGFQTYIAEYFARFPELSKRVCFIGTIADRERLSEQYRAAKIFALSSTLEGGTPMSLQKHCTLAV